MIIPNNCTHTDLDKIEAQLLAVLVRSPNPITYAARRKATAIQLVAVDRERERLLKIAKAS